MLDDGGDLGIAEVETRRKQQGRTLAHIERQIARRQLGEPPTCPGAGQPIRRPIPREKCDGRSVGHPLAHRGEHLSSLIRAHQMNIVDDQQVRNPTLAGKACQPWQQSGRESRFGRSDRRAHRRSRRADLLQHVHECRRQHDSVVHVGGQSKRGVRPLIYRQPLRRQG